ncbi:MAG: energy-coupling factor transporter transmembrane protein EcfT [Clostridiales bacterium]|nr:energy-coupling factor transporter transmembrane protein EcfT [Clostridiales bacterium]
MVRDIALGQYFPGRSVLHRMDARVKIVLLLLYIVLIFVGANFAALLLTTASVLFIMGISGVPVKMYLKSLKMILFIVLFTSLLNLFYGQGEPLVTLFGFMNITQAGINNCIFVAVRIATLILASSVLTFTTSPTDLTDALERLMKPLTIFHIKVHEIAMMMTIALRFVPTLLEETDKIMSAQKARGADMESGGLMQRVKALLPILIPLFVSSFRRAGDLAMAMECRCYRGGEGRTRMSSMHMGTLDAWVIGFSALILAGVIVCNLLLPATIR